MNKIQLTVAFAVWVVIVLIGCARSSLINKNRDSMLIVEKTACYSDSDCVPDSCCHASAVVNKKYAPDCTGVACTQECSGPMDCGMGKPACVNNACTIVPSMNNK